MKVKDLLAQLAQVDQELEVAVCRDDHEYWGRLYTIAESAKVTNAQVDGLKRPDRMVFLIE